MYLLYTGSEPQDFEFKFEVKLDGAGANSGVQFRATRLGEEPNRPRSKWETRGYQADFDNGNSNVGALIECCSGDRYSYDAEKRAALETWAKGLSRILNAKPKTDTAIVPVAKRA